MIDLYFSGEWVSVEDRLPEFMQQVLVANNEGGVIQAWYHTNWDKKKQRDRRLLVIGEWDDYYDIDDPHLDAKYWCALPVSPLMKQPITYEIE